MVRRRSARPERSNPEAARTRNVRQARGKVWSSGAQNPRLPPSVLRRGKAVQDAAVQYRQGVAGHPQLSEAERAAVQRVGRLQRLILVVGLLALLRLFVSVGLRGSLDLLPLPTWEWDLAAFTPLLAFLLLWDAHQRGTPLSGEIQGMSGFYLFYAIPGVLTGHWQLSPAVAFIVAAFACSWYRNRQG